MRGPSSSSLRLDPFPLLTVSFPSVQINSANELILTELILENILADFEPEEIVALLSCFVFQEKTDIEPEIPARLKEVRRFILLSPFDLSSTELLLLFKSGKVRHPQHR